MSPIYLEDSRYERRLLNQEGIMRKFELRNSTQLAKGHHLEKENKEEDANIDADKHRDIIQLPMGIDQKL